MSIRSIALLLCLYLCSSTLTFAQRQASVWYFGDKAGLDFNFRSPIALTNGALSTFEGSASIADESGNLLFYTDGVTVYNRLHQPMPNGRHLWGSYTTTQTLIVPKPGSDPIYFIFTASPQFKYIFGDDSVGFHYSTIDMNLNSGLGDVVEKNTLLFKNTTEKITAVHHANGHDIWVIAHEWGNNRFRFFLINDSGIQPDPIQVHAGTPHDQSTQRFADATGQMKISPNATKIALNQAVNRKLFEVFEVRTETEIIVTSIFSKSNEQPSYGVEFSPNSQFVYYTLLNPGTDCGNNDPAYAAHVWQYSITTGEDMEVGEYVGQLWAMQLALDGKIYIASCNDIANENDIESGYMAVINFPNRKGVACGFEVKAVSLNGRLNRFGLPGFVQSYFLFPDPEFDLPNVFTPNGDIYNPVFQPYPYENIIDSNILIFNRWGQTVFSTRDVAKGWDGGNNPSDIYYWQVFIEGKNGKIKNMKGWVHLLR